MLQDPENYVHRLQKESRVFNEKALRAKQEAEMAETEQCTFAPKVNDAPGYIKRIARSMALARAARPPTADDDAPDWR